MFFSRNGKDRPREWLAAAFVGRRLAKSDENPHAEAGRYHGAGEQYPDEKLQELFQEQINETKMAAAKRPLSTHIDAIIATLTGIVPEGAGTPLDDGETSEQTTRKPDGTKTTKTTETTETQPQPRGQDASGTGALPQLPGVGDVMSAAGGPDMTGQLLRDIVSTAGTNLAQRRIVARSPDNNG
jgi:hypothetical protein